MSNIINVLDETENYVSAEIESRIKQWLADTGTGMGKVMQPLRLSVVGALKGPHLFDILEMIGKEESIARIRHAMANLS
jgi:glutamyl/glutaminyl-tRNA synthetase